jgi:hypothetical protein
MGEKGFNLGSGYFGRMTHVVEVDVTLDPADVGLLRATKISFEAEGIPSASFPSASLGTVGTAADLELFGVVLF